jgi:hypothetical protein
MQLDKKGQLIWEDTTKWVLAIIFLVVVALLIFANKELLLELLEKIRLALRFGG